MLETEQIAPYKSHKNTRKWCRGKKDVPHDWQWMPWEKYKGWTFTTDWMIQVCSNCGKTGKWEHA